MPYDALKSEPISIASVIGQEPLLRYTFKKCSTPAKNLIINTPATALNKRIKRKKRPFKPLPGYDLIKGRHKKTAIGNNPTEIGEKKRVRKSKNKETPLLYSFNIKQLMESFSDHDRFACRVIGKAGRLAREKLSQLGSKPAIFGCSERLSESARW